MLNATYNMRKRPSLIEIRYCIRFYKQWRNKGGKWRHTVLSAGLGDASTHFAVT